MPCGLEPFDDIDSSFDKSRLNFAPQIGTGISSSLDQKMQNQFDYNENANGKNSNTITIYKNGLT